MDREKLEKIIKSFVGQNGLISHHLESMNLFTRKHIYLIIQSFFPLITTQNGIKHVLNVENISVECPEAESRGGAEALQINGTSIDCKFRRKSYIFPVYVDITQEVHNKEHKQESTCKRIKFCEIPAMIGVFPCRTPDYLSASKACFIINGNEKCIFSQEALISNFPIVTRKDNKIICSVRSLFYQQFKSSSTVNFEFSVDNPVESLQLRIPSQKSAISVLRIFPLFNYSLDTIKKDKLHHETFNFFFPDVHEFPVFNKHIDFAFEYLPHCVLPSLTPKEIASNKIEFTFFILRRIKQCIQEDFQHDNIDDLQFKAIVPPGHTYALLFRQRMKTFVKGVHFQVCKGLKKQQVPSINSLFPDNNTLSATVHYAHATGNWGANTVESSSFGVSQICNKTNHDTFMSQLRLVNIPLSRDGKTPYPRQLHPSYYGILCANETPEGRSAGLINAMTYFAYTQSEIDADALFLILRRTLKAFLRFGGSLSIFVNGSCIGKIPHSRFKEFEAAFIQLRVQGSVPFTMSYDYFEETRTIYIFTQAGRVSRAVFDAKRIDELPAIVDSCNKSVLWHELRRQGIVQYISKNLEKRRRIGTYILRPDPEYDYYEIHPFLFMHGLTASKIPFSNHNQAPRNIYQSNMGKQAVGVFLPEYLRDINTENKQFYLDYPQLPLCQTIGHRLSKPEYNLTGVNCVVAIMCFSGYNQEDSIVVNRASLERGLFRTTYRRLYNTKETNSGNLMDRFMSAESTTKDKVITGSGNYKHVKHNFYADIGAKVQKDDVLVHKVRMSKYTRNRESTQYKDCAISLDTPDDMVIERVELASLNEEERLLTVTCVANRVPIQGDKLSSRHGQKGVIGVVMAAEDMPRTSEGIIPDLIINCHAIPSRMTIGQLMEAIKSRSACFKGKIHDATAFEHFDVDVSHLMDDFRICNLNRYGEETMYCGRTGVRMKHKAYMGMTYYQRLKHFVNDKLHARSTGAVDMLTMQPLEGRSRKGGLRLGEMERDSLIAHGAAGITQERMTDSSDKLITYICAKCGLFTENPPIPCMPSFCRVCMSFAHTQKVKTTYAYRLLIHELLAIHIAVRHKLD